MMTVTIYQFSGTGNTWFVAHHLKRAFTNNGVVCNIVSIENTESLQEITMTDDIIGIGYPIYGSDIPEPVLRFFDKIKMHAKQRAFVYCTQFMYSGDGAAYGAKKLRKKGFIVHQLAHFNMPNNITDYKIVRWIKPKNVSKLEDTVIKQTKQLVKAVLDNTPKRKGDHLLGLLLGLVQRVPFQYGKIAYQNSLKIDSTCILCMRCVRLCPSQNLKHNNKNIETLSRCCLCYRCVNHCPVQAIHFTKKTRVKTPYLGPTDHFDIENVRKYENQ